MSEKTVKVVLLKHSQLGNPGDTVEVTEAIAKVMTAHRDLFDGQKMVKYRTARLASEEVKEAPIEATTQAEMDAKGKKNIVKTPDDEILPKRLKGMGKNSDEAKEEKRK
jgi:hypothetical protein